VDCGLGHPTGEDECRPRDPDFSLVCWGVLKRGPTEAMAMAGPMGEGASWKSIGWLKMMCPILGKIKKYK
jgi:hypothetical protein